jgi:erythromycin 3''-O-methyltransferase
MLTRVRNIGRIVRAVTTRDPDLRVRRFYELPDPESQFADRATRYINIGYWASEETTVDEAGDAIAALLAEAARFEPGQEVLDVGCGFGDQDFLWLRDKQPATIHALDVTPHQIAGAQARAEADGVADRVRFRVGTATELDFPDSSFDRVVALDAALHFNTREDFFREAYRVLRPGGVLGTVDTIPLDAATPRKSFRSPRFSLYRVGVPDANWYDRDGYEQRLAATGFTGTNVLSIRDRTWEPWYRHWSTLAHDDAARANLAPGVARVVEKEWADTDLIKRELDRLDYVVAVAVKPS